MCTALTIATENGQHFFGRNMDLGYSFNQSVIILPRNYEYECKVTGQKVKNHKAIIGIGTEIGQHAVFADAMNENGLACAGLNFEGYAHFEDKPVEGKNNIAPYDFIQWVLSNHTTIDEVAKSIQDLELVGIPLNEKTPLPMLHWMITDSSGRSMVVEKTKERLIVCENPVGVMTNNPTFDWHLTNLNEYLYLSTKHPEQTQWGNLKLKALGLGSGTLGIPGDFASVSRFVRIAFIRSVMPPQNNEHDAVTQFFHMLDYVKMVKGGIITDTGILDFTTYSSCMNLERGIYYYKTYDNSRINAVHMNKENLDGTEIITFPYAEKQDINFQN